MDKNKSTHEVQLGRYQSAADIPLVAGIINQVRSYSILNTMLESGREDEIRQLEIQLDEMITSIDGFYDLLGNKNWIFHENLHYEKVKKILRDNSGADDAEKQLIALYDKEYMDVMLYAASWFEASRNRLDLIDKARNDYFEGRYYSCVLVLLAVIDGFVNEFESKHKGFHARKSTDFSAWDSIISHHKGIERIHNKIYSKSVSKTKAEAVYDLYRHGIMHGTIINYDNIIVATKAWNLLFSVLDWAKAKEQADKPQDPGLSIDEFVKREAHRERGDKIRADYAPYSLKSNDEEFNIHIAAIACMQFLDYWLKNNYGGMSKYLTNLFKSDSNNLPKKIREEYQDYTLDSYEMLELESTAPVLVTIRLKLVINGVAKDTELKWIYETDDGVATLPQQGGGEWHLRLWGALHFIKESQRRKQ